MTFAIMANMIMRNIKLSSILLYSVYLHVFSNSILYWVTLFRLNCVLGDFALAEMYTIS